MSPTGTPPGLAWPGPDTGPTPPPEYHGEAGGAAHPQAAVALGQVEVPLRRWAWCGSSCSGPAVVDNPIIPVADAFNQAIQDRLVAPRC